MLRRWRWLRRRSRSVACRWFGLLLGGAVPRERVGPEAAGAKDAATRLFAHAAALAHFGAARYADVLRWASLNDQVLGCALRVASQAQLGQLDAARESLAEAERSCAELTFSGLDPLLAGAEPEFVKRLHAGIALAGWSE